MGAEMGGSRTAAVATEAAATVRVVTSRFDRFSFIEFVLAKNWKDAFAAINGQSMFWMLRLMATIDPLDLKDLMDQKSTAEAVYMPRIQYAADVVLKRTLPAIAPGDLDATKQVQDARNFLATKWLGPYLMLPRDLTGTFPTPNPDWVNHRMTDADLAAIATSISLEVALIQAIKNVESGAPFQADGRPIVRYELHVFYGNLCTNKHGDHSAWDTSKAEGYARTHPFLADARPWNWTEGNKYHHYGSPDQQAIEWSYIYNAMILRPGIDNALACASYGTHQIMGFNFAQTGAPSIRQFVNDMCESEAKQFERFEHFMLSGPSLSGALRAHQWQQFADGYNGAGSNANHYADNLKNAYQKITGHT
jgi:hypothetical protein